MEVVEAERRLKRREAHRSRDYDDAPKANHISGKNCQGSILHESSRINPRALAGIGVRFGGCAWPIGGVATGSTGSGSCLRPWVLGVRSRRASPEIPNC